MTATELHIAIKILNPKVVNSIMRTSQKYSENFDNKIKELICSKNKPKKVN